MLLVRLTMLFVVMIVCLSRVVHFKVLGLKYIHAARSKIIEKKKFIKATDELDK